MRSRATLVLHVSSLEKRIAEAVSARIEALYGAKIPVQTEQPKQTGFGERKFLQAYEQGKGTLGELETIRGERRLGQEDLGHPHAHGADGDGRRGDVVR